MAYLNDKQKEKVKEYGLYLFIIAAWVGILAIVLGFNSINDWIFLAPLTIVVTECIWWAIDAKPEPKKNIDFLECSACGEKFENEKAFEKAMKDNWCSVLENDKDVSCKPVKKTEEIEGESVFWFTARWKAFLLFISIFIASGFVAGKKIYDVYQKEIGLLIIILAVAALFVWTNSLKFKRIEDKVENEGKRNEVL